MISLELSIPKARRFIAKLRGASQELEEALIDEAQELTTEIWTITTSPPPLNSGNRPPTPYWVRHTGRVVSHKNGQIKIDRPSYKFSGNIKHVQRKVRKDGVHSKSTVPYAVYVSGRQQPAYMRAKGWKKLSEVGARVMANHEKSKTIAGRIQTRIGKFFGRF